MRQLLFFLFLLCSWCSACKQVSSPDSNAKAEQSEKKAVAKPPAFVDPFSGGLAIVRQGGKHALINTNGDTLIPSGYHGIQNTGLGLAILDIQYKQTIFNQSGQKVYECSNCQLYTDPKLNRIFQTPKEYQENNQVKNDSVVVMLGLEGIYKI